MDKRCKFLADVSDSGSVLYLLLVSSYASVGKLPVGSDAETEVLKITGVQAISLRNAVGDEDRISELVKLLSSGVFYFATSTNPNVAPLDLTLCAQRAALGAPTDNRFLWLVALDYSFAPLENNPRLTGFSQSIELVNC